MVVNAKKLSDATMVLFIISIYYRANIITKSSVVYTDKWSETFSLICDSLTGFILLHLHTLY